MSNDSETPTSSPAVALITAGSKALAGVPGAWIGSAAKTVGRLIGYLGAVPAAMINAKAQAIKDDAAARTALTKAVARQAAKGASSDPEIVARGIERWGGELARKQANREAIVEHMLENLKESGAPPDDPTRAEIEDDWLNVFERYAEDASSERAQRLWGRVLSGEIRTPGKFSLATLRFLSELDQRTANDVQTIAPYIVGDKILADSSWLAGEKLLLAHRLESAGILSGVGNLNINIAPTPAPGIFTYGRYGIKVQDKANLGRSQNIALFQVNSVGINVASLAGAHDELPNWMSIIETFDKSIFTLIEVVEIVGRNGGILNSRTIKVVHGPP